MNFMIEHPEKTKKKKTISMASCGFQSIPGNIKKTRE